MCENHFEVVEHKRTKHWIIGGVSILIGAIVAVYLKNNHEFVIDISNKVSEYINRYRSPEITSLEVHHIGFLKVHKAGGSTVQNVLFRFGLKRRLSFVMPIKGSQYKFSTYGGKCAQLFKSKSGYHDILALHSVFNESVYRQILPNDSVNIAIVREPLSLMISGAYFHRDIWKIQYLEVVPKDNFIKNLIRYPELYDPNEFSLTRNSMAMDFGFPRGFHVTDTAKIENYLEYLQSKFPLVMLVEHFDESMILLKRLLHWRLEDMLYIPLNVYKHPTEKELNISVIDRKKFQERNFLDVAIYRFFKEKFIQTVSSLGTEFQNEVEYFRKIRISVEEYCVSKRQQKVTFVIEESKWNKQAVVLPSDCEAMLTNELDFIDKIRAVMRQNKAGKRLSSVT
ncbi:galactosylceramide sulfotransferase-like isoform X2 [Mercenaria mercenaria]|uniref:galactosylceramide sulfotransferase-like isoform X2 n=1 Tax=Mercenaria mercenaria TaxID=6596 RepID=UPI00234F8206|nr:galactosylceramide sulfotransferase-like isoform X2 [Mercenaria mercenaria]